MRLIILTSAASLLAMTSAFAADAYAPSSLKDTSASPVVYNWTGFYLGANVGGGWSQLDSSTTFDSVNAGFDPGDSVTLRHTNAASGIVGGGQAGFNWQTGSFLLGVESDFGFIGVSQTRDIVSGSIGGTGFGLGTTQDGGFLADVTGRAGYVSGPALFYVKGGWAYLDGKAAIHISPAIDGVGASKTGFGGWTLGGGIEYALSPAWSIKGEYQYFDFGSFDLTPDPKNNPKIVINNDLSVNVVRVGLNYHVGGGYSPLK